MPVDAALHRQRIGHFQGKAEQVKSLTPHKAPRMCASARYPSLPATLKHIINGPAAEVTKRPLLKFNRLQGRVISLLVLGLISQSMAAGEAARGTAAIADYPDGSDESWSDELLSEDIWPDPVAEQHTAPAPGDINEALFHELKQQHLLARHQRYDPADKAALLAGVAHYAEQKGASHEIVASWLFTALLGNSPEITLARRLASKPEEGKSATLADMQTLLRPETFSSPLPPTASTLWQAALNQALPYINDPEVRKLPVCSPEYAALYTGARYLTAAGVDSKTLSREEVARVGDMLWELAAAAGGMEATMLPFFAAPALFCLVLNQPDIVQRQEISLALQEEALAVYLQERQQTRAALGALREKMLRYAEARQSWQSRSNLAEKFISVCRQSLSDGAEFIPHRTALEIKQRYLNGREKPCATAPDITIEYEKQTREVSEYFAELDRLLIRRALEETQQEEKAFINADDAIIYPVKATLEAVYNFRKILPHNTWHQRHLDLFLVTRNNEERIYLLTSEGQEGYQLQRVDRNIDDYLHYKIFSLEEKYEHEFLTNHAADRARLKIHIKTQRIPPAADERSHNQQKTQKYINYLQRQHRDNLYHALYQQGYDPSTLEKIWRVVKAFIPFYECIEGAIKQDAAQAVPACLLDLISFIPVAGQASLLAGKFGTRLARGIQTSGGMLLRQGLTRPALREAARGIIGASRLPTNAEMRALGRSLLRAADPGVETVISLSIMMRSSLSSLTNVLKQVSDTPSGSKLVKNLQAAINRMPDVTQPLMTGWLAERKAQVAIKPVEVFNGKYIYRLVEAENSGIASKHYWLDRQGKLHPLNKIELLLTRGLSGRGAPEAASRWVELQNNQIQALIMLLRDNPQVIALSGGLNHIARINHLSVERLKLFINEKGELTPLGLRKVVEVGNVTPGVIARILLLSRKKFPAGDIANIAEKYGISRARLENYISQDGVLTPLGEELLAGHSFHIFNRADARRIVLLNRLHPELDTDNLALIFNLDARKVHTYFRANGRLTKAAINRMFYSVSRSKLWELLSGKAADRTPEKLRQYAEKLQLEPDAFSRYFHADGSPTQKLKNYLKLTGENLQAEKERVSLPRKTLQDAENMQQTGRRDYTISINNQPVHIELTEAAPPGATAGAPQEIVEMKVSAEDAAFIHRINNNLPILQDPDDPRISVLLRHEGALEAIRVTHWSSLHHLFREQGRKASQAIKKRIHQEIFDWLSHEGELDKKFSSLMYAAVPLDDDGPARGLSVFARRDIAQFTVLGPYSGKLHESEASLNKESRRVGRAKVLTYLWETKSGARTVSGFGSGNILSLMNTSRLPGGKVWRYNNVVAIRAGKSLTFYIAAEDIKAGNELLVDYGETYNPVAAEIKQEPLSPQPGPSHRSD